jgi:NADH:ubiquinone oxidoreductase subunit 6 (subunit J)
MTLFHWSVLLLLAAVVVAVAVSRRPRAQRAVRDDRVTCNICGEAYPDTQVVERTFVSGYSYFFCLACAAALAAEAQERAVADTAGDDDESSPEGARSR